MWVLLASSGHVIEFSRRLNQADARYFFLGRRRECNVATMLVATLDGELSLAELVEEFVPDEGGVPRFADYLRRAPLDLAPPVWMPLPEEERIPERYGRELSLPPEAGWEGVFAAVDEVQSRPFHPRRAPWEVAVLKGVPGGRTVLVMKVHHVLSDGMAFAMLIAKTVASEALAATEVPIEVVTEPPPRGPRLWIALRDRGAALRRWLGAVREFLPEVFDGERRRREWEAMERTLRPPHRWPRQAHTRVRRLAGFRVPTNAWRTEAECRGGGSNELFLALAARVMRRSFPELDFDAEPLRVGMPISLRSGGVQAGGNTVAVAILELRGGAAELTDLSGVRARATAVKQEVDESPPTLFEESLEMLPGRLRAAIDFRRAAACDVLATNIPIPREGKLLGRPVEGMLMVAPAIGQAVSFSLTTYGDDFYLAANADPGIVPEGLDDRAEETLAELFGEGFERFGG